MIKITSVPHWNKWKTSIPFNNLLLGIGLTKQRIMDTHYILTLINRRSASGDSQCNRTLLMKHLGKHYNKIMTSLEEVGLIEITRTYCTKDYDKKSVGKSFNYVPTDKLEALLKDNETEYLYRITSGDIKLRRDYNNYHGDRFRQSQAKAMGKMTFNMFEIQKEIDKLTSPEQTRIRSCLIDIKHGTNLQYNDIDHRLCTPWNLLPNSIRGFIHCNNYKRVAIVDIRAAYVSLLGMLIHTLNIKYKNDKGLNADVNRWNDMWLDPHIDPRETLAASLNLPRENIMDIKTGKEVIRHGIKDLFNFYINGKRGDLDNPQVNKDMMVIHNWMTTNFPTMMKHWKKLHTNNPIKHTGVMIGKLFETKLMQDDRITDKAFELGLIILNEHDGCSIFGKDDSNVKQFTDYITNLSKQIIGVQLVFKSK